MRLRRRRHRHHIVEKLANEARGQLQQIFAEEVVVNVVAPCVFAAALHERVGRHHGRTPRLAQPLQLFKGHHTILTRVKNAHHIT